MKAIYKHQQAKLFIKVYNNFLQWQGGKFCFSRLIGTRRIQYSYTLEPIKQEEELS